ncbi:hypothetical protein [Mesorhizobium delmotii]|uniref:hypothetical protein n=1 Tax=Mesorhizobium delmotii TaxID=1631247 RepID=UPI000F43A9A8|nr:hypothetical protein [Mesorhizobium delmotii]
MSSKPRRQRLTADVPARALDLLSCFQCDRHDDHMARTAAFVVPIAQPQKIHNAMKMVAAPVHTPRSLSISGVSNAFSESITGDRFMLLMDLDFTSR